MKIKTSITLSEDLIIAIEAHSQPHVSRSEFIEMALRVYLQQLQRDQQNARDLEIINRRAAYLNQEAEDVLEYQVVL